MSIVLGIMSQAIWIYNIGIGVCLLHVFSRDTKLRKTYRKVYWFVRPFLAYAVCADLIHAYIESAWYNTGWDIVLLIMWITWQSKIADREMSRNDDDDDDVWKKLKNKITETVQQVGARLVVIPQPSGA